jgi:hypothetical protein
MSEGLRERGKETTGGSKSRDVGRRSAGRHGDSMDIIPVEGLVVRYHVLQWEARGESRGKGARQALVQGERAEGQATKLRIEEAIGRRVEARFLRSRSRC